MFFFRECWGGETSRIHYDLLDVAISPNVRLDSEDRMLMLFTESFHKRAPSNRGQNKKREHPKTLADIKTSFFHLCRALLKSAQSSCCETREEKFWKRRADDHRNNL